MKFARNQKSILETSAPSEREMDRERKRVETLPLNPKGNGRREKARCFKPPPPQSKREVRGIGEEVCGLGFGVEMTVGSYRVRAVSLIVFLLHTNLYLHLAQTNRRRFTVTVSRMLG